MEASHPSYTAKQEDGCQTNTPKARLTERLTLRFTPEMGSRWQRRADEMGIDLSELIRRTMNGQRTRPVTFVHRDDLRHLTRMALWSTEILASLRHLAERSTLEPEQAIELEAKITTLLELFCGVAEGEISVQPLPPSAESP